MRIREASANDFAAILGLYRQLQPADPILTDGRDRVVFGEILRAENLKLFVLVEQGRIASTCYLNIIPNITRSASSYAIIENVVTDETCRGNGYGRTIVGHATDVAWAAGCYKVMLQTGSRSEAIHAFYRSCGFSGDDKQAYVAWRPSESGGTPAPGARAPV